MASNTNNVKLGVCRAYYDGNDLGYTKGGVEVEVSTETHKVTVDQFGSGEINDIITGRSVSAKLPLAETTLDNLIAIMPGATLVTDGVVATQSVTFSSSAPVNADKVTINGVAFTFKTSPSGNNDMAVPADIAAAATALAAAVNDSDSTISDDVVASAASGVVTLNARDTGVAGNAFTLTKTGTNIAVGGATFASGVDHTKARVDVPSGVGTDLLAQAKKLVLRPIALDEIGDKSEDFIIPLAATPGALTFAYKSEEERIFNTTFMGYPDSATQKLFMVGDETAS